MSLQSFLSLNGLERNSECFSLLQNAKFQATSSSAEWFGTEFQGFLSSVEWLGAKSLSIPQNRRNSDGMEQNFLLFRVPRGKMATLERSCLSLELEAKLAQNLTTIDQTLYLPSSSTSHPSLLCSPNVAFHFYIRHFPPTCPPPPPPHLLFRQSWENYLGQLRGIRPTFYCPSPYSLPGCLGLKPPECRPRVGLLSTAL
jgi:hypothetical protein